MKKAFLVGINKYSQSPLRGCVNDVISIFQILTTKFGFVPENIKVLTDHEATRSNIINGLKWLTTGVSSGDSIVFHYSGHGSQVMVDDWTSTTETDGRDEIICPVNMDWNTPLRDHEIGAYFKRVPKDCTTLVIIDSCHSGTGLRNGLNPLEERTENDFINRFISPPLSNILTNPSIIVKDDLSFDFQPNDKRAFKSNFLVHTVEQGDAILISGCQDNQTSADAWIDRKYRGAMTYTLSHVLAQSGYNVSYKNLVSSMNKLLDRYRFTQNPQLECKKEFFNEKFLT